MAYVAVQRSRLTKAVQGAHTIQALISVLKDDPRIDRKKFNKFCDEYAKWVHDHGGSQYETENALAWLLGFTVIEDDK